MSESKQDNRKVKCPVCEEQLYRRDAIRHTNKRYYHEECYEEATKESRHYKELIETICDIWGIDKPTKQMVMQIKRYKDEFNCTYKGMELTLNYFYRLLDNNPREGDGIGIIPWEYDNATKQYIRQMKINEELHNLDSFKREEIVVKIDTKNKKDKRKSFIDIDSM